MNISMAVSIHVLPPSVTGICLKETHHLRNRSTQKLDVRKGLSRARLICYQTVSLNSAASDQQDGYWQLILCRGSLRPGECFNQKSDSDVIMHRKPSLLYRSIACSPAEPSSSSAYVFLFVFFFMLNGKLRYVKNRHR